MIYIYIHLYIYVFYLYIIFIYYIYAYMKIWKVFSQYFFKYFSVPLLLCRSLIIHLLNCLLWSWDITETLLIFSIFLLSVLHFGLFLLLCLLLHLFIANIIWYFFFFCHLRFSIFPLSEVSFACFIYLLILFLFCCFHLPSWTYKAVFNIHFNILPCYFYPITHFWVCWYWLIIPWKWVYFPDSLTFLLLFILIFFQDF